MDIDTDGGLSRNLFGKDFKWGVSTAAYQIEGSHDIDEKGSSIWDVYTERKNKILNGHHGKIACDFYNRYPEDLDLVKQLNIPNFRFSTSWSRILPNGTGAVNQKGIDFYNRVIDKCLENGTDPWLTLYHWDLPHALEQKGGWTNRDVISWFSEFAVVCAKHFGDRVKNWIVMNEPMAFTGAGYFLGVHAPGRTGAKNFIPAVHHTVLSISEGGRILKDLLPDAEIGTTFSCSLVEPFNSYPRNIAAAHRIDALLNRMFIEPILGMGYPKDDLWFLKKTAKYFHPGDEDKMAFDFDFIGIQNYTREIVKSSFFTPYVQASLVKARKRNVPFTSMGWEVYPQSIYEMIKKFNAYKGIKKLYITENGASFDDVISKGEINDTKRTDYIRNILAQVLRARSEGLNVEGYFAWTLTDNFEWTEGYHPRFGLVYVDFDTQQRIIKSSGHWYANFLKG
ncbi:GH1 family beta-glucosidase [Daejeonella lutea]|uniref:Beta-glucosidase n=1 Tax=Daejeonella lutea TaxID=572036 RepID=A0A1T5EAN1_9SPHI|nr:GH1 family beta-glucosidase [Daejeonella lutea]SKB81067.1 beta-glucosidase [Daejeonella lutea]